MNTDSTQRRLRLERIVRAPPAHAFGAFVDPQSLSEWWGPIGFTVPRVDLDARAGGRYRIEMQPPERDRFLPVDAVVEPVEDQAEHCYRREGDDRFELLAVAGERAEQGLGGDPGPDAGEHRGAPPGK